MSEEKNAEQNVQIKMFSIVSLPMILIKIVGSDSLPNNFWRTSSDNLSSIFLNSIYPKQYLLGILQLLIACVISTTFEFQIYL